MTCLLKNKAPTLAKCCEGHADGLPLPSGEGRGEGLLRKAGKSDRRPSFRFALTLTLSRRERGPCFGILQESRRIRVSTVAKSPRVHPRCLLLPVTAATIALGAAPLLAADAAAAAADWRGPGSYLSVTKILACWLLFLAWVRTTDWVNRDTQAMNLNHLRWNPIVFGSFLACGMLFWLIPSFWVGYPLLLIGYLAPLIAYVVVRNKQVHDSDKVFTADHLRWTMAQWLGKVGIKISAEKADPNASGAPVSLFARGGPDDRTNAARLLAARQSTGLKGARELLADALATRASAVMLDFGPQGVVVRYMVDGVWLPRESREREVADPALEALKLLCGLNPQDRQHRQEGQFGLEYSIIKHAVFDKVARSKVQFQERLTAELTKKLADDEELGPTELEQRVKAEVEERVREKFASPIGPWTPVDKARLPKLQGIEPINPLTQLEATKCQASMASQGTRSGERVLIQLETKPVGLKTLADLGMREKMQEQLAELLQRPRGFVLFSAMPGGGLRTTMDVAMHATDRFLREFATVEEATNRYKEVENIPVTTYKTAAGESPASVLPKLFHNEPNVVLVRDLVDAQTVSLLCRETVAAERLMIGSIRAKDGAEALLRVLMLKVPPQEFAAVVAGVLCQRLLRKLCDKCKEPYAPAPQVLQQLGIPEGRVRAFYRPRQPKAEEEKQEVCAECGGIGYRGQTAIFELIVVDDALRKVLATTPKLDLVRQAARKAGMRSLQEEGILLVARGATSLPELMRVMKQ